MPRPQLSRRHPDLFASAARADISSERTKLLALMSVLLVETLSSPAAQADCRSPSSCRSPRRPEERIGAVVGSAAMLSLLSEAHRIVHGSQESDPSLCRGAALVAAATLVADPLHQSPPAHGVFRAGRIRAYQRRHAIGIIEAGNEVAHVDQFRPRCRVHSVRHRGYGLFRLAKSSRKPGDTDQATSASSSVAARLAPYV